MSVELREENRGLLSELLQACEMAIIRQEVSATEAIDTIQEHLLKAQDATTESEYQRHVEEAQIHLEELDDSGGRHVETIHSKLPELSGNS